VFEKWKLDVFFFDIKLRIHTILKSKECGELESK
jgi:hypothetical protein